MQQLLYGHRGRLRRAAVGLGELQAARHGRGAAQATAQAIEELLRSGAVARR